MKKSIVICIFFIFNTFLVFSYEINFNDAKNLLNTWMNTTNLNKPASQWSLNVVEIIDSDLSDYERKIYKIYDLTVPQVSVSITLDHNEDYHYTPMLWSKLNEELFESSNFTISERIICKVSHLLDIPANKIRLDIGSYCYWFSIQMVNNKTQIVDSSMCMSASRAEKINISYLRNDVIDSFVNRNINRVEKLDKIGNIIFNGIVEYYEKKEANIKVISQDIYYLSFKITNIKNEILDIGYWESIELSIFINDINDYYEIRSIVDGGYKAGFTIPNSQDYVDMRQKYQSEVQDYCGIINNEIRNILTEER